MKEIVQTLPKERSIRISPPMMKIYLAGPISGKSYDEVVSRYKEKITILSDFGYEVLSPMTGKSNLEGISSLTSSGYKDHPISNDHAIFERDKWMVTQADIVLVDLSNVTDQISIGSMMELAWASYLNKHTVLVINPGGLHDHAFVHEATDVKFVSLSDAYDYLKELALSQRGVL
jgi:nucleoside 2-deoxyribosyltransferase